MAPPALSALAPASVYVPAPATAILYTTASYAPPLPKPTAYAVTTVAAYVLVAAVVLAYFPTPTTHYQQQGRDRGQRGYSRGRSGGGSRRSLVFASQPPMQVYYQGGVPAPGQGTQEQSGTTYAPNPYKRFNNWNTCFGCGIICCSGTPAKLSLSKPSSHTRCDVPGRIRSHTL